MIDIVFPKDDEEKYIEIAQRLGIKGICFVYDRPKDIEGIRKAHGSDGFQVLQGIVCDPKDVVKYRGKFITLCRAPEDQSMIRTVIEQSRPDILYGLELSARRDFMHHRASGLNHVLATIAANKGVAIAFSFTDVMGTKPQRRSLILGRMMQNIGFARKFRFKSVIASFARTPYGLRAPKDLVSFYCLLGMDSGSAAKGLGWRED